MGKDGEFSPWKIHPEYGMDWKELDKIRMDKLSNPKDLEDFLKEIDMEGLHRNYILRDMEQSKAAQGTPEQLVGRNPELLYRRDIDSIKAPRSINPWLAASLMALTPNTAEAPETKTSKYAGWSRNQRKMYGGE